MGLTVFNCRFLKRFLEIYYIGLHCCHKEILSIIKKEAETAKPMLNFRFRKGFKKKI